MKSKLYSFLLLFLFYSVPLFAQEDASFIAQQNYDALELRNIGPAMNSGRIADIAIHPGDENLWYVAVGSGGVWKTTNAGVTWEPIFDDQPSYSIGCVTVDPNNPHTVWVGTGENVGGRHVGYGDGVYKSTDGGKTWKNMGLKSSEHISKIIVHPENSDIIWVAAQGPLWSEGGERGLYKSTNGGETWSKVLGGNEWTGVTDLVIDPRDPDLLYAATWQRHRNVAAYMGGGPGSGIHRSRDGGETWQKLTNGIPGSNLGKIGLAISPQQPDIVYAAIELDRRKGGVFRSTNQGASWTKMSDAVSGGTGPHYYQELYASPHHFGRLYLVSNYMLVSNDHGNNFSRLNVENKHVDDHAVAFRKGDPDYLLVGTDGGLYETFDHAENWRYIPNLPIMQYYKVAVDDAEPFYNVYGGTQDNGSNGGPSRTDMRHGIRNADWFKTLGADGHQSATEPGNPNIMYAETQQGGLHRVDRITGEQVFIQPQAREGEGFERYNWDAPILVSPHKPSRLYFASQRVWKSEDRGDSWTPISGDLTRNQERLALPIMGKVQSWDNAWDVNAMSNYNTITSLAESPRQEGLVYAGTDDGIIQVTEDGGQSWRKIEVGSIRGIPATAFVNDIKADLFDPNTVYVALDNHKYGDFSPYLIKSTDRGRSWTSISSNIPERTLVWRLVQDHENKDLLFAATEFGVYFTVDGGGEWIKLKGGAPTISFRDITIQRSHNDLVAASFGRGFFILDDYTPLRHVNSQTLQQEAALFPTRQAYWYTPKNVVDSQGASHYTAPNPPFGAVFTYYLRDGLTTLAAERKKREKELAGQDVPFPGWDKLEAEVRQQKPEIQVVIKDETGNVVRRVSGPTSKGFHRINWNLRHASRDIVDPDRQSDRRGSSNGFLATPGTYTATLTKVVDGQVTTLSEPISFDVVPLREGALEGASYEDIIAFRKDLEAFQQDLSRTTARLDEQLDKIKAMRTALMRSEKEDPELVSRLHDARQQLLDLDKQMNGSEAKNEVGERNPPTPRSRMYVGFRALSTTYGPTATHKETVAAGRRELTSIKESLDQVIQSVMPELAEALKTAGAPPLMGQ